MRASTRRRIRVNPPRAATGPDRRRIGRPRCPCLHHGRRAYEEWRRRGERRHEERRGRFGVRLPAGRSGPRVAGAWIYTIARRACLAQFHKRKRSKVRLAAEPNALPPLPADVTETAEHAADDALDEHADRGAVRALALLPENQREALLLRKVHGRSVAEAAAITGTTSGALKLRVHRGYTTLRRLFKNKQEMESRP
jgi:RNA polymerase sigma factor (sigma-70 family)